MMETAGWLFACYCCAAGGFAAGIFVACLCNSASDAIRKVRGKC